MNREAICMYCKAIRHSDPSLPFFESREDGTRASTVCAHCGFYEIAHQYEESRVHKEPLPQTLGHDYRPRGAWQFDSFYCGCRGWD